MHPCFDFGTVLIIFDPLGKINLTIRVYAFGKFTRNKHIQADKFFDTVFTGNVQHTCMDKYMHGPVKIIKSRT